MRAHFTAKVASVVVTAVAVLRRHGAGRHVTVGSGVGRVLPARQLDQCADWGQLGVARVDDGLDGAVMAILLLEHFGTLYEARDGA